jgi:transcriptional regulator with XRE-family HTH domain
MPTETAPKPIRQRPRWIPDPIPTPHILTFLRPGTTLGALHRATGISISMLSKLFNGQRRPSLATAERIATSLGITLEKLSDGLVLARQEARDRRVRIARIRAAAEAEETK